MPTPSQPEQTQAQRSTSWRMSISTSGAAMLCVPGVSALNPCAIDKLGFEHGFLAIHQEQRLQAVKRPW